MKLWRVALRNIFRNKRRSLLSGTAIVFATAGIVFMFSFIAGMLGDMVSTALTYDTGHVRIRHADYQRYETLNPVHLTVPEHTALQQRLVALPAVHAALARIRTGVAIYRAEENHGAFMMGLDFGREVDNSTRPPVEPTLGPAAPPQDFQSFAGAWQLDIHAGTLPQPGARELLMSAALAQSLGVQVGDKLTLLTQTALMSTQAWTFRISGLVSYPNIGMRSTLIAPLATMQEFLKMDRNDAVTETLLYGSSLEQSDAVHDAVAGRLSPELNARTWNEGNVIFQLLNVAQRIYDIFALAIFLLASTVIVNTTMMVVYERMKEIGTIAAMGMTGGQITRLFFLEAFFIGVAAAAVGVLVGMAIVLPLSQTGIDMSAAMEGVEINLSSVMYPQLSWTSTVLVFLYSIAITAVASYWPTRRAARMQPVEALRGA